MTLALLATGAIAQPANRRAEQQKTQKSNANNMSTRAQISFPAQEKMDDDVAWRRDIYREISLLDDANAGLYYPKTPIGSQMNLFTYIFKLVMRGQLKAYIYRTDGNEVFNDSSRVRPLQFLEDQSIYFERTERGTRIDDSDIPSEEVKAYYVKESSYYDQSTATFHTKVQALCPIRVMADDFGDSGEKRPLFWVVYDDLAPFLSNQTMMTSNLNNAATMSVDDYFTKNLYKGKIYKTNNLQGRVLANYCETDSAMNAEQQKIEKQLTDFEAGVWGRREAPADSTATLEETGKKGKSVARTDEKKDVEAPAASNSRRRVGRTSSSSKSSGSAPSISARRQRR